ncbi:hypothetical protein, partial [Prevotella sp.]
SNDFKEQKMCIKGRAAPWAYGLIKAKRPARAKALIINAFALTGRIVIWDILPRALPWAMGFCPFGACCCDF